MVATGDTEIDSEPLWLDVKTWRVFETPDPSLVNLFGRPINGNGEEG